MDVIVTALGEFVWSLSCAIVNFSLSTGLSVLAVFVSVLCAILASAFYKYTTSREQMSVDDDNTCNLVDHEKDNSDKHITITSVIEPSTPTITTTVEPDNANTIQSLSEIEICIEENPSENGGEEEEEQEDNEATCNDFLIDTIEGSEEEIQKQQIANIYRLLNDQNLINNWTATDFLDQLKMYGLEACEENELELS